MNTPLRPLFVLALALAAAAPARAASAPADPTVEEIVVVGKKPAGAAAQQSVPDDFIGPLAPGQCYASQCPGALAPAESALDPKVLREQMKADGTYKTLTETKDGALIQLKDGSWTFDDNSMCYRSMPLGELVKNPSMPAAIREAAQKALAGQNKAADQKEQDKKDQEQICGSLNGGVDCQRGDKSLKDGKSFGITSVAPKSPATPAGASSDAGDKGAGEGDQTDWQSVADTIMGRNDGAYGLTGGSNGTDGGAGSSRADEGFRRESQAAIADINDQVRSGATIDPGSFGFVNTRKAAQAPTLQKLQTGKVFDPAKQDDATAAPQGSRFFGR